ncbi:hypothetical protein D3C72_1965110 [compost metagenome]
MLDRLSFATCSSSCWRAARSSEATPAAARALLPCFQVSANLMAWAVVNTPANAPLSPAISRVKAAPIGRKRVGAAAAVSLLIFRRACWVAYCDP